MSSSNSESVKPEPVDGATEFAFWLSPDGRSRVEYALPVLHELDFEVNEGYRRIPHGGIEIGGFLWGRFRPDGLTIEAFRQIPCEHAAGPSFVLSDRDIVEAEKLLAGAPSDEGLRGLQPVGWFVAHTRGPLTITDREMQLFQRWFPEPGRVTLLVKPERFQPTRFGLLVRQPNGQMDRDAALGAFILPLPGRAGKGVAASIPAPIPKPPSAKPVAAPPAAKETSRVVELPCAPGPSDIEKTVPAPHPTFPKRAPSAEPVAPGTDARPSKQTAQPRPAAPVGPAPAVSLPAVSLPAPPVAETPAPAAPTPPPAETERKRPQEQFRAIPEPPPPIPAVERDFSRSGSVFRLFLMLVLAAALGCAVGYFAYLQLPSAYIQLRAEKRGTALVVHWSPDATRSVDYVAVRVDDGPPQPLTTVQKKAGEYRVQHPTDNTKVELIAQHWLRDSRGIVRYISAEAARANPGPASEPADRSPISQEP